MAGVFGATLKVSWTVQWLEKHLSPDVTEGVTRRIIGVNGKWPIEPIVGYLGDRLELTVVNRLETATALHCHGFFQNGTGFYDGAAGVTECGIPAGSQFTYNISLAQTGTYWIHGHRDGQYVDGLRTALIVNHPVGLSPWRFDDQLIVTLSDWYHTEHNVLLDHFLSIFNPLGKEPVPDAGLINDSGQAVLNVLPAKTYLVRVACLSAIAMFNFYIEGHSMLVVEVDGEPIAPMAASSFPISAAQRYAFLLATSNSSLFNYRIHADMDLSMFDNPPASLNPLVNATLSYGQGLPLYVPPDNFTAPDPSAFDEMAFQPLNASDASTSADKVVVMDMSFDVYEDGINHGAFNHQIFHYYPVPALYTAATMGSLASNPAVYGPNGPFVVLDHFKTVDIVINNLDANKHPIHIHGHKFQVIQLVKSGVYDPATPSLPSPMANPPRRDTIVIEGGGYAVLRLFTDNPGVWLMHCHIEWHLQAGLAALLIEAPNMIQKRLNIPAESKQNCLAMNKLISGNAAGVNDSSSFPGVAGQLSLYPTGFSTRGAQAAILMCVFSAFIGLAGVVWYGLSS